MSEHKLRQRQRQVADRVERVEVLGKRLLPDVHDPINGLCGSESSVRIIWDALPAQVDPVRSGQVSAERGLRKRWQIESFRVILDTIVGDEALRIVDFCSGSGNFGLALAALLPRCSFVLIDRNVHATNLARQRAADAGLTNVSVIAGSVESFTGEFDVAIAMHACGNASDYAQAAAIKSNASYIMAPCCVGKLKQGVDSAEDGDGLIARGPRSKVMRRSCTHDEFLELASFADHEAAASSGATGSLCKRLVEHDRASYARECGWTALAGRMVPESASAKCDVLVGLTPNRAHLELPLRSNAAAFAAATEAAAAAAAAAGTLCEPCAAAPEEECLSTSIASRSADKPTSAAVLTPASEPVADVTLPNVRQCGFYITRRQRNCRQPAESSSDMCAAHSNVEAREAAAQQDRARRVGAVRLGDTLESLSVGACIGLEVEVDGCLGLVVSSDANKDLLVQLTGGGSDGESDGEDGQGDGGGGQADGGGGQAVGGGEIGIAQAARVVCVARSGALLAREVTWSAPVAIPHDKTRERGRGATPNPLALHNLRAEVDDTSLDAACALLGSGHQLHVDLCCGDGSYVLGAATAVGTSMNVAWLGLDFHAPAISAANAVAAARTSSADSTPSPCAFLCCNCHQLAALARLLDRLSSRGLPLGSVSIRMQPSWPKARHAQRRLLSAALLELLHSRLAPNGRLLVVCAGAATDEAQRLLATRDQGRKPQWRAVAVDEETFPPSSSSGASESTARVLRYAALGAAS